MMTIEAKINDRPVEVLIDSGSNKACISSELAKELKLEVRKLPTPMGAKGIGGSVNFIGLTSLDLTIGKSTMRLEFAVANHRDIFHKTSFLALISYGTLRFFPPFKLDAAHDKLFMDGECIRIGHEPQDNGLAYATRTIDQCVLGPNMITRVPVYVDGHATCDGYHVEGIPKMENAKGFAVNPALLPREANATCLLFITNPSMTSIKLQPGTKIAQAFPVRNVDEGHVRVINTNSDPTEARIGYMHYMQSFQTSGKMAPEYQ
jgi:hypothetical protein